jgi:hypothetical protein
LPSRTTSATAPSCCDRRQSVPLTDDEQAAVNDGEAALSRLLDRLADTPTPAGPTPRQLDTPANATSLPIIDVQQA